jgi:DNA-binding response OmpR family regulator
MKRAASKVALKRNKPGKQNILIVEDEKPLARAVELKLKNEGYVTQLAHDGEEALAAIDVFKPALMILDLVMPKLDGFGVLEEVRRRKLNIPILVVSSLGQPEDEKRVLMLGAKEYLPKSITPLSEIVAKIKKLLP